MSELKVKNNPNILKSNEISFEERQEQLKLEDEQEKKRREKEKKSPYDDFLQVNNKMYKAEDWLMSKSPIAYRTFRFLINNMDGYNSVICSYQVLQEQFNVSKETIRRAIKLLKEKQYIEIYKSGTSNVYAINKEIVWKSWGNQHKYAKFGANIILSEIEQEKNIKLKIAKHNTVTIKDN